MERCEHISVRTDGEMGRLILQRPERRNALGLAMVEALARGLDEFDANPAVTAIIIEGSPPGFCAGSDLKELGGLDVREMCAHEARAAAVARAIGLIETPVVVAVEGFAIGGGFMLAAACDVVVTAADARWHLPEVRLGWIPPWGLHALSARVGAVRARQLVWGARPLDGREAHRMGLADELAAPGEASAVAIEIARGLAALPAGAIASTKRFFTSTVTGCAEASDAEANRLFAGDCLSDAAQRTLTGFRPERLA